VPATDLAPQTLIKMIQADICRLSESTNATRRIFRCGILIASLAIGLTGCVSFGKQESDVKIIYERSAQYHMLNRNPVIEIPGILGSKLIDRASRRTVWGAFDRESGDPTTSDGAQLISLPVEGNRPLSELRDGLTQDEAFADNVLYWLLEDPRTRRSQGSRRANHTFSKPGKLE